VRDLVAFAIQLTSEKKEGTHLSNVIDIAINRSGHASAEITVKCTVGVVVFFFL